MDKYLASEGLFSKLMPVDMGQSSKGNGLINADKIYDNAIHKFEWSNINKLEHFDVDSNQYYEGWIYPNIYTDGMQALVNQGKLKEAREFALKAYYFQPKETKSMRQTY